jgi:hypothetical protein
MQRHEFLRRLHRQIKPKTYLEIGVNTGASLRLSRSRTIGIDPQFKVVHPLRCNLVLAKATSDDFFARPEALAHFRGKPTDLAFIDGMHLFEFALRDFINVERETSWTSVVVFDDMLPRDVHEAARDRETKAWTGDVYKVIPTLREYRPDLVLIPVDTQPTGLLVVLAPDRTSTVLTDHYDEIEKRYVVPDPQDVADEILNRGCAYDPEQVLAAPFWDLITAGRAKAGKGNAQKLTAAVRDALGTPGKAPKRKRRSMLSR